MAISLIQRGSLKEARYMVKKEYRYSTSPLIQGIDPKLRRMCLGVWAKLQYGWELRIKDEKARSITKLNGEKRASLFLNQETTREGDR